MHTIHALWYESKARSVLLPKTMVPESKEECAEDLVQTLWSLSLCLSFALVLVTSMFESRPTRYEVDNIKR